MAEKLFLERVPNYVGGRWQPSANPEHVSIANPATGEPLGSVPIGAVHDVDDAVRAAAAAYPAWREMPAQARARYLFALRASMEEHFDELCSICTQEHGKTLDESNGDGRRAIDNAEVACGAPSLMLGAGAALKQIAGGIYRSIHPNPIATFGHAVAHTIPSQV